MTILITDPFDTDSLIKISQDFKVIHTPTESDLLNNIKLADALLIRSKTKINSKLLNKATNLKFIATATSGLDHIDLELCKSKNIEVFNPKEVNSISAAEHSFALLLTVMKNLKNSNKNLHDLKWKDQLHRGSGLHGKSIGIIGLGRVGSKVARFSRAFNMEVQAYDPYKDASYFESLQVKKITDLDLLINTSNIISLHTPLTSETKHLLHMDNLKLAEPSTVLINTSRGSCINEPDLIKLLKSKKIKAAGLDVFEQEPINPSNELLSLDNVFLSQHIGAYTNEAFKDASFGCTKWVYDKLIQH